MYEAEEGGHVDVCVVLSYPEATFDILDNQIVVNVSSNDSSVYIPIGSRLASELNYTVYNYR